MLTAGLGDNAELCRARRNRNIRRNLGKVCMKCDRGLWREFQCNHPIVNGNGDLRLLIKREVRKRSDFHFFSTLDDAVTGNDIGVRLSISDDKKLNAVVSILALKETDVCSGRPAV